MLPHPVLADLLALLQRRRNTDQDSEGEDGDGGDQGLTLSRLESLYAHLAQEDAGSDGEESSEEEPDLGPHTKEELVALITESL